MSDTFPHTNKSRFSSFLEESEPIFDKEKRVSTFLNRSKPFIFGLFQPFLRLSNTTVSTCIGDMRGTCLPLQGRSWKGHVYWMHFSTGLQEIQDDISSSWGHIAAFCAIRSQTAWMKQACSRHHACRNAP